MIVKLINTIFNTIYNAFIGGFQFGDKIASITDFAEEGIETFTPYIAQGVGFARVYVPDAVLAVFIAFISIDLAYMAICGVLAIFRFIKNYVPVA